MSETDKHRDLSHLVVGEPHNLRG